MQPTSNLYNSSLAPLQKENPTVQKFNVGIFLLLDKHKKIWSISIVISIIHVIADWESWNVRSHIEQNTFE